MSGGGKGGRETTEVKIPEWLEAAAKENLARGQGVANIGYTPYYGPDVAAMTPLQIASNQGLSSAAGAFGLGGGGLSMGTEGMPAPQTFAGGVQGYSSGGLYDEALRELETRRPGQYNAITGMFVDPITGAAPLSFGPSVQPMAPMAAAPLTYPTQGGGRDRDGMGGMSSGAGTGSSGGMGGYTGLRDMFDGGGPGKPGKTFEGGGRVSGIANAAGISPRGPRDNKGRKK
jgi:hypothetical protein